MTSIGERGVTLSGGQKSRISLARAVYHEADIYLLDDPLSAVDLRVGREIFDNCLRGLLKDKLTLMVSHQINYVVQSDLIVMMNEGAIVCSGTYEDIVSETEFCMNFLQNLQREGDKNIARETKHSFILETKSANTSKLESDSLLTAAKNEKKTEDQTAVQPLSTAMSSEDYRPNSIGFVTYLRYFWAGGFLATLVMLVLTILDNGGLLLAYWWMQSMAECSQFTATNLSIGMNNNTFSNWSYNFCNKDALVWLAVITFSSSVILFLRGINFYYILLQAGRRLHNRMLRRLLHTPMHFFDTNPSGRVLNRFAKDIGFLDEQLPLAFYDFWLFSSYNLAIIIATCIVQYYLIIPLSLLLISMLGLRYYYLRTSTQVKQLESVARSPLYSHISLTLQGLSTIRALSIEKRVTQDLHLLQDQHACTWYYYICCNRWFGMRLDLMTSLVIVFAVFYSFFSRCIFLTDELVGFSIPLLLSLAVTFQYMIRQSGEVEVLMVSVDRILNYCRLPQEPLSISEMKPSSSSMSSEDSGVIEFKNVHFRYAEDLPYSLADVSLRVSSGEKIGIVGWTGAGKTSLLNSLLRINPISSGSIRIGGRDISSLNLYEHRKRVSVIPQDPFLFSGTLRYNLDPFDEFTGDEVWSALDKAHLKRMVASLPDQLMAIVEEDGLNFSTGERQLLCLARAILRKNKIILIDEATANVDMHTDALVQQAIRTHFSDCSVLTIAHRIETIIDSDRLVILDKGRIVASDIPHLMLRDDNSYLSAFLSLLAPETQSHLRDVAEKAFSCLQLIN